MKRDLGWLWHGLAGFGIVSLALWLLHLSWWIACALVSALFLFGYLREEMQHDFQPLSAHRWLEALTWGLGGGLGLVWLALI